MRKSGRVFGQFSQGHRADAIFFFLKEREAEENELLLVLVRMLLVSD